MSTAMSDLRRFRRHARMLRHPRWAWWALVNWCKGYRFSPVRRCRLCDHTWPHHYPDCPGRASVGECQHEKARRLAVEGPHCRLVVCQCGELLRLPPTQTADGS